MSLSILVIGAENPRIRDLFREVGRYAEVSYLDTEPITFRPKFEKIVKSWRWKKSNGSSREANLLVPGRWQGIADALTHWFCRRSFSHAGRPDVIVFTWPQLASLAEKITDVTRVYYCKDPFEQWTCWNRREIREMESRLLKNTEAVFAVSRLLVDDFRPRTEAKVVYLPNGLEESFLKTGNMSRPANLPSDKPVIGCIGQINITYDWKYIAELAATLPEMTLCFVGNISEGNPYWRRDIVEQLAKTPNILWLDRQPHEQVPAYMQHFDISICLLKADAAGDRRSPLRLYDYLTSERPIISTPVREAYEHLPHIHIAESGKEAAKLARRIVAGEFPVDVAARKKYVEGQTWANRAEQFMNELREVLKLKSSNGKTSGEPVAGVGIR